MTPPDFGAFQAAFAPYARYVPGFAFLQGLAGGGQPTPEAPPMTQWVAPVFDVEELDRRIRDLKAVHFWLEQNARALQATIQALEVQKMTLATLKGMNVSLNEMAQVLAGAQAPAAAPPGDAPTAASSDAASAPPGVDPVRWWRSLTDQFQVIAANAMQEMTQQTATAAATAMAGSAAPAPPAPAPAPASRPSRPSRARPAAGDAPPPRRAAPAARAPSRKPRP